MRSVIKDADQDGIARDRRPAVRVRRRIAAAGLVPILEPEVSIDSPHKEEAEALLHDALRTRSTRCPPTATSC